MASAREQIEFVNAAATVRHAEDTEPLRMVWVAHVPELHTELLAVERWVVATALDAGRE